MTEDVSRRPIASRNTAWAKKLAEKLAAAQITPNQISQAAIGFAAFAGIAFALSGVASGGAVRVFLLIFGIIGVVGRLLCNLLDGMVADESGYGEADGAFWNEVPDRLSDIMILVGVGFSAGAPMLGWAAAAFAICTAYVREFGRAEGLGNDYSGPMAKPHRMAAVIAGAVVAIFWSNVAMLIALVIIVLATIGTIGSRAYTIIQTMEQTRPSSIVRKKKPVKTDGEGNTDEEETTEGDEEDPEDELMQRLKDMTK
ncbi:CDP-alcohol phosphatidyltransferase family protein [Parasulfitobacter algicola]|uniref:CDP-alcohol phosphatidyltransferase family protein n=1 Tax=Parasulfitobacter algicola TaxID=2614809 RepID=A0ABX2ISA3_9RHOB|nr:CDP-alcohol phosphatidyltransferase family protein [Sulfitobacter algicola]NSX53965.1 CDP-alcohol phosphatidyltransferase family protein [Sulfitobacter algicola]